MLLRWDIRYEYKREGTLSKLNKTYPSVLRVLFAISEDPREMQHNDYAAFHQGLHILSRFKKSSDKIIQYFFLKYNLTPLDMYNGLSRVYCFKPGGRTH